jgi:zinc protease
MKPIRRAAIAVFTLAGVIAPKLTHQVPRDAADSRVQNATNFETKRVCGLLMLLEDPRFPLVTMRLSFLAGSKFDPKDIPGLSSNVAALLTEGTASRPAQQLAEDMTTIGGTLHATSSPDALTLAGNCLSENAAKLLELAADVTLNANFPEDEIQLRKQNRNQEIMAQHANAAFLATEKFDEIVYGDHPYSHISATPE